MDLLTAQSHPSLTASASVADLSKPLVTSFASSNGQGLVAFEVDYVTETGFERRHIVTSQICSL